MNFKKLLMVGTMSALLGISTPSHAIIGCAGTYWICFFQDIVAGATALILRNQNNKHNIPVYDVKTGLDKIRERIGMFQEQGKCGVSATGNSGCTDEKNMAAAMGQGEEGAGEMTNMANVGSTTEAGSAVLGGTEAIIQLSTGERAEASNMSDLDEQYVQLLGRTEDNTFDAIRANVTNHVFESDEAAINANCTCSAGTGAACSSTECAKTRQNKLLIRASQTASATADAWLKEFQHEDPKLSAKKGDSVQIQTLNPGTSLYDQVESALQGMSGAGKISEYIGKMNNVSYNASILAIHQMALMTYDLRAQSYRNLMYSGLKKEDMTNVGGGN